MRESNVAFSISATILALLFLLNGIMLFAKPKGWAVNRWSLYPKQYLYVVDSLVGALAMRLVGAYFVLLSVDLLLFVHGRILGLDKGLSAVKVLLNYGHVAMGPLLVICGMVGLIRPSAWIDFDTLGNARIVMVILRVIGLALAMYGAVFTLTALGLSSYDDIFVNRTIIVMLVCPLLVYFLINGCMYIWNPTDWSASDYSLSLPSEYKKAMGSGDTESIRSIGLMLVLISLVMLWSVCAYFI